MVIVQPTFAVHTHDACIGSRLKHWAQDQRMIGSAAKGSRPSDCILELIAFLLDCNIAYLNIAFQTCR